MQKARGRLSAPTACRRTVSGSFSLPCSGFFPPFPHGTGSLSVFRSYLALRHGRRGFGQDSTCPALLRWPPPDVPVACTGLSPSPVCLSRHFQFLDICLSAAPTTPPTPRRRRFGLLPFRSPLLRESIFLSSPAGTKMFQFPAFAPALAGARHSAVRVPPFGLPRINSCLRIPVDFRSLPRPSSLPEAQASPVRPSPLSLLSSSLLESLCSRFSRLFFVKLIFTPHVSRPSRTGLHTDYIFFFLYLVISLSIVNELLFVVPSKGDAKIHTFFLAANLFLIFLQFF